MSRHIDSAETARARGLIAALTGLISDARAVAEAELESARRAHQDAVVTAHYTATQALGQLQGDIDRQSAQSAAAAITAAGELAPGLLSEPFDSALWVSEGALGQGDPRFVRIGVLSADERIPAVLPVFGTCGWLVTAPHPRHAGRLLDSVLMRILAAAPAARVRVDGFDPGLTGVLGRLGTLATRAPDLVSEPGHTAEALAQLLGELHRVSAGRGARLAQYGASSYLELPQQVATEPLRLIVIADYPRLFDATAHRDLVRLAVRAGEHGITLLVHHNPDIQPEHGVDPGELAHVLLGCAVDQDTLSGGPLGEGSVRLDAPPEQQLTAHLNDVVAAAARKAALPVLALSELVPAAPDWRPIEYGAGLSVHLAREGLVPVETRLRSEDPALPNMLVGGSVGRGKSNFLMVLIHALGMRYSPLDLEMYLLDFKHGVEFAALGPSRDRRHWLPHVKVLGLQSDEYFGLAVLNHLRTELRRRSEDFKRMGIGDIARIPAGSVRIPRILVVLDEFQVLLQNSELASEAVEILESIARQGRSFGIHLVLATQTVDGIAGLATKRDAILGQIHNRVVFYTNPTDSALFLQPHNTAAAALRYRGQAVFNEENGAPHANRTALVAYADAQELDLMREDMWRRAKTEMPARTAPFVFDGDRAPVLSDVADRYGYDTGFAWVGTALDVVERPVGVVAGGAAVIVLGDGPSEALRVLGALAHTAANAGSEVIVLDGDSDRDTPQTELHKQRLRAMLRERDITVRWIPTTECAQEIDTLAAGLDTRSRTDARSIVVGVGLHAIADLGADGPYLGNHALTRLFTEGANRGVSLYGWWDDLASFEQHIAHRDTRAAYVFLKHPPRGVAAVCGPRIIWDSPPNRALFRSEHGAVQIIVPFAAPQPADEPWCAP